MTGQTIEIKDKSAEKAAEILLQLIDVGEFKFFHNEQQDAFCKYLSQKSDVYEVRRLNDVKFKNYLSFIYRKSTGKTISNQAVKEALAEMEGRALHDADSKMYKVFLRVGESDNKIYIDLCNNKWQAVEISDLGWKILDSENNPVRFKRSSHALPLPDPSSTNIGDINKLWDIINVPKDDQILVLAFILECYRFSTAFPVLVLLGLQGSGKSATQNTIRNLIDPNINNLRTAPRKPDDLVTDAASNWLGSYNNVSHLSDEMHDDFCCISTGSGFATRKFYTNTEQIVVNITRPVCINGIFNFIRRPDLLDRAIILELAPINESKRKTDAQLSQITRDYFASIFRGLLDLLVKALQLLPTVKLDKMPRMADFALLGIAIEKSLGLADETFINQYKGNRANAKECILDSSPIMLALVEFIDKREYKTWRGRPSELLEQLTVFKKPNAHTSWIKTSHAMGGELKRYSASLQEVGIQVIDEAKLTGKKNRSGIFYQISRIDSSEIHDEKTSPPYPQSPLIDCTVNLNEKVDIVDFVDLKTQQS